MNVGERPANNAGGGSEPPVTRRRWPGIVAGVLAATTGWFALGELGVGAVVGLVWQDGLWAAAVIGAALGFVGRARLLRGPAVGALVLLLVVEWTPWPASLARGLIRADSLPTEVADAVVVLSASITDDGLLSPVAMDRLSTAIELRRSGAARDVVVSRIAGFGDGPLTSEADQRRVLAAAGITSGVHVVGPVGDTRLEAVRARELGDRLGWTRLLVVTTPTHTRRACAAFEAVGYVVTCRPSIDRRIAWDHLESPADRAVAFGDWLYESLGWIEYRARGWVTD